MHGKDYARIEYESIEQASAAMQALNTGTTSIVGTLGYSGKKSRPLNPPSTTLCFVGYRGDETDLRVALSPYEDKILYIKMGWIYCSAIFFFFFFANVLFLCSSGQPTWLHCFQQRQSPLSSLRRSSRSRTPCTIPELSLAIPSISSSRNSHRFRLLPSSI
ncbi:hypothetical protein BT96DRAFT_692261 [Gymnopus androsaceus JB14]|uniref:RRM domain-containing protein n=1 Tax=Gymnopus androsaceus JB14 TaxID=1447944 RepID=A0A6A4HPZ7_9AGAR|nr:hypothetical protein BT96DRAFT_692261 [Gymnopus androsaceus JB14]